MSKIAARSMFFLPKIPLKCCRRIAKKNQPKPKIMVFLIKIISFHILIFLKIPHFPLHAGVQDCKNIHPCMWRLCSVILFEAVD